MSSPTATIQTGRGRSTGRTSSSITPVAWLPVEDIDLAEWAAVGRRLGAMGRCGQWGLGDWIRYGNTKFGERYARAARITGYDVQTLMNMVYVASRFETSRRRENLSWSHHETLAALDAQEQEHWLDRAAAEKLSISDIRLELRRARRGAPPAQGQENRTEEPVAAESVVCPHCGKPVPLSNEVESSSASANLGSARPAKARAA
jgi:hypothetical protein